MLRARPAKPITPNKAQQKAERAAAVLAQLEETHARRLQFLEEQQRQQQPAAERPGQGAAVSSAAQLR